MITKKETRLRRSRKTRAKIAEMKAVRLSVFRSNSHIYAQVIAGCGSKVLAAASTVEAEVRSQVSNGGNKALADIDGKLIAASAMLDTVVSEATDSPGREIGADIKDEATLVGLLDRFEIWNPERFSRVKSADAVLAQEAFKLME